MADAASSKRRGNSAFLLHAQLAGAWIGRQWNVCSMLSSQAPLDETTPLDEEGKRWIQRSEDAHIALLALATSGSMDHVDIKEDHVRRDWLLNRVFGERHYTEVMQPGPDGSVTARLQAKVENPNRGNLPHLIGWGRIIHEVLHDPDSEAARALIGAATATRPSPAFDVLPDGPRAKEQPQPQEPKKQQQQGTLLEVSQNAYNRMVANGHPLQQAGRLLLEKIQQADVELRDQLVEQQAIFDILEVPSVLQEEVKENSQRHEQAWLALIEGAAADGVLDTPKGLYPTLIGALEVVEPAMRSAWNDTFHDIARTVSQTQIGATFEVAQDPPGAFYMTPLINRLVKHWVPMATIDKMVRSMLDPANEEASMQRVRVLFTGKEDPSEGLFKAHRQQTMETIMLCGTRYDLYKSRDIQPLRRWTHGLLSALWKAVQKKELPQDMFVPASSLGAPSGGGDFLSAAGSRLFRWTTYITLATQLVDNGALAVATPNGGIAVRENEEVVSAAWLPDMMTQLASFDEEAGSDLTEARVAHTVVPMMESVEQADAIETTAILFGGVDQLSYSTPVSGEFGDSVQLTGFKGTNTIWDFYKEWLNSPESDGLRDSPDRWNRWIQQLEGKRIAAEEALETELDDVSEAIGALQGTAQLFSSKEGELAEYQKHVSQINALVAEDAKNTDIGLLQGERGVSSRLAALRKQTDVMFRVHPQHFAQIAANSIGREPDECQLVDPSSSPSDVLLSKGTPLLDNSVATVTDNVMRDTGIDPSTIEGSMLGSSLQNLVLHAAAARKALPFSIKGYRENLGKLTTAVSDERVLKDQVDLQLRGLSKSVNGAHSAWARLVAMQYLVTMIGDPDTEQKVVTMLRAKERKSWVAWLDSALSIDSYTKRYTSPAMNSAIGHILGVSPVVNMVRELVRFLGDELYESASGFQGGLSKDLLALVLANVFALFRLFTVVNFNQKLRQIGSIARSGFSALLLNRMLGVQRASTLTAAFPRNVIDAVTFLGRKMDGDGSPSFIMQYGDDSISAYSAIGVLGFAMHTTWTVLKATIPGFAYVTSGVIAYSTWQYWVPLTTTVSGAAIATLYSYVTRSIETRVFQYNTPRVRSGMLALGNLLSGSPLRAGIQLHTAVTTRNLLLPTWVVIPQGVGLSNKKRENVSSFVSYLLMNAGVSGVDYALSGTSLYGALRGVNPDFTTGLEMSPTGTIKSQEVNWVNTLTHAFPGINNQTRYAQSLVGVTDPQQLAIGDITLERMQEIVNNATNVVQAQTEAFVNNRGIARRFSEMAQSLGITTSAANPFSFKMANEGLLSNKEHILTLAETTITEGDSQRIDDMNKIFDRAIFAYFSGAFVSDEQSPGWFNLMLAPLYETYKRLLKDES